MCVKCLNINWRFFFFLSFASCSRKNPRHRPADVDEFSLFLCVCMLQGCAKVYEADQGARLQRQECVRCALTSHRPADRTAPPSGNPAGHALFAQPVPRPGNVKYTSKHTLMDRCVIAVYIKRQDSCQCVIFSFHRKEQNLHNVSM